MRQVIFGYNLKGTAAVYISTVKVAGKILSLNLMVI